MKSIIKYLLIIIAGSIIACSGNSEKNGSSKTIQKKKNPTTKVEKNDSEPSEIEETKTTSSSDQQDNGMTAKQIAKAKEIISSVSDADIEAVDAKKKFRMFCSTCHGFKGDMMVNGAKDLTKSSISLENAVAQVYHGKGLMTPYKGVIKDAEIVALCHYIETLR